MVEAAPAPSDLSVLAAQRVPGEAISSWLARCAQANLLTLPELASEIGCSPSAFDRGQLELAPRLADMLGEPASAIAVPVSPDLIAHPIRAGPAPPACWAVCCRCLQRDVEEGVPPHVRAVWTHPLATMCFVHGHHLVPYATCPVRIVSSFTLFGEEGPEHGDRDTALEAADFDDRTMLNRVERAFRQRGSASELLRLRFAVRDVVDALATQARPPRTPALMHAFEGSFFQRRSLVAALQLPESWWADLDAVTRLLYVRTALFVLSEPKDPAAELSTPLGSDWLLTCYDHSRVAGWQRAFDHAVRDPLFLLTTELPRRVVAELSERSMLWPKDLRKRWTYAAAVGAVGGYVF